MSQEKRTLLAVVVSIGILIVYSVFFAPKPSNVTPPPSVPSAVTTSDPALPSAGTPAAGTPAVPLPNASGFPQAEPQLLSRETPVVSFALNNVGSPLRSWKLKEYHQSVEKQSPLVEMVRRPDVLKHLALTLSGVPFPELPQYTVEAADDSHIVFAWRTETTALRVTYTWDRAAPILNIDVEWQNLSAQAVTGALGIVWQDELTAPPPSGFLNRLKGPADTREPLGFWDGKRQALAEQGELAYQGRVYWVGISDRYFLSGIVPVDGDSNVRLTHALDKLSVSVTYPSDALAAGEKIVHHFRAYLGPKNREALLAAGFRLEESIDYGWFSFVAVPILWLLKAFYGILHNWGLAIIALTLLIKLLLSPITKKSMQSMKSMQKLQPELAKLREKYKNNRERLNTEMMALFRTHKVNPIGGCLPMILQMPIYIALYKVLYTAIELYHSPFFGYYKDLAAPDPYFVAPILLGIFMVLQQKLTPATTADPMQQKMMMFMPVIFSAFMLFLPAGLVIYIFVNTATSVLQQWMMHNDVSWRGLVTGKWKMENGK